MAQCPPSPDSGLAIHRIGRANAGSCGWAISGRCIEVPVQLTATAQIPGEWAGQPVELELWLGGEGFVRSRPGTRPV